jgi:hypothetical protein
MKLPLNASGKGRRNAKHGGQPQAELLGTGFTNQLCAPYRSLR